MGKAQGLIEEISERLCEDFKRGAPLRPGKPRPGESPSKGDFESVSAKALENLYESARREKTKHKLGILGRARVAFALQQRLLEAGYPAALVKQVLFALLTAAFIGDKP